MAYEILIKNGMVIDGTGAPGRRTDVGIAGGKIVEVGALSDGARRTIDADGLIVAPGFIDPHTHYDAQICWDGGMTPSSWHGVTSSLRRADLLGRGDDAIVVARGDVGGDGELRGGDCAVPAQRTR